MTRDPIPDWDRDPIEIITAPVSARRPSRLQLLSEELEPGDEVERANRNRAYLVNLTKRLRNTFQSAGGSPHALV